MTDWEARARRLTAEFRADCRTRLDEPALANLIEELKKGSAEFSRFWKQHDVLERQGGGALQPSETRRAELPAGDAAAGGPGAPQAGAAEAGASKVSVSMITTYRPLSSAR
jgi:hypothetical protein